MTNLAPVAPGSPVFGVCRPGHLGATLGAWCDRLEAAGVEWVVCLLAVAEAKRRGLPEAYADRFRTIHTPIHDRHLPTEATLSTALEAIRTADRAGERCALHCNAGLGRTGVVAAAWLAEERDYGPKVAIKTVEDAGRTPREAVRCGNATTAELHDLLTRERGRA